MNDEKSLAECCQMLLEQGIATDVAFLLKSSDAIDNQILGKAVEPPAKKTKIEANGTSDITEAFPTTNGSHTNEPVAAGRGDVVTEEVKIHAHKCLLIARSPVFYSMFTGPMAFTNDVVQILDCPDADAFKQMLHYIYGGDLKLTGKSVMTVLHLARKYELKKLANQALRAAKSFVTDLHVFKILESALKHDDDSLVDVCLLYVQRNTQQLLATDEFLDVSGLILEKILSEYALAISENTLVERCVSWAVNKLNKNGEEPTGANMRGILGQCLYKLQFHKMDAKSFTRVVVKRKLLPQQIAFDFYQFILGDDDTEQCALPDGFSCDRKQKMYGQLHVSSTLQKVQFSDLFVDVFTIDGVQLKTNKPIEISHISFLVILDADHNAEHELCHLLDDADSVVVNGTACCASITCDPKASGETKFRKLNGQVVMVSLCPLIRVLDECTLSLRLTSTASIKLFPIGVDQLSDDASHVNVSLRYASVNESLPLYNIGYSLCNE